MKESHMHKLIEYFRDNKTNQGHPSLQATVSVNYELREMSSDLMWIGCPGPVWDEYTAQLIHFASGEAVT